MPRLAPLLPSHGTRSRRGGMDGMDDRGTAAIDPAEIGSVYWRDIARSQPLSRAEEEALASRIKDGDRGARDRLVTANLRFVVRVARAYTGRGLSLAELISEGNWGLVVAARKFDQTFGTKFISYAVWWVRQSILKALSEQRSAARLPQSQLEDRRMVARTLPALAQELGRNPTFADVAACVDISPVRARDAFEVRNQDISLDGPRFRDDDEALVSRFYYVQAEADEALEKAELVDRLQRSLAILPQREIDVITAYFGLGGRECLSMEAIGREMGLTRERVRQIRNRALARMRRQLERARLGSLPT